MVGALDRVGNGHSAPGEGEPFRRIVRSNGDCVVRFPVQGVGRPGGAVHDDGVSCLPFGDGHPDRVLDVPRRDHEVVIPGDGGDDDAPAVVADANPVGVVPDGGDGPSGRHDVAEFVAPALDEFPGVDVGPADVLEAVEVEAEVSEVGDYAARLVGRHPLPFRVGDQIGHGIAARLVDELHSDGPGEAELTVKRGAGVGGADQRQLLEVRALVDGEVAQVGVGDGKLLQGGQRRVIEDIAEYGTPLVGDFLRAWERGSFILRDGDHQVRTAGEDQLLDGGVAADQAAVTALFPCGHAGRDVDGFERCAIIECRASDLGHSFGDADRLHPAPSECAVADPGQRAGVCVHYFLQA